MVSESARAYRKTNDSSRAREEKKKKKKKKKKEGTTQVRFSDFCVFVGDAFFKDVEAALRTRLAALSAQPSRKDKGVCARP